MTAICVFCGASPGKNPKHLRLARAMGRALGKKGHNLIYGGGGLGLMGAVARATNAAGGHVLGIMPDFLADIEKTLTEVEHIFVPDMHARKIAMFERAEAFIVLPGGIGTLEEAIEVMSWMRLNLHSKPIVFLDNDAYWQPIIDGLLHVIDEGFASEDMRGEIIYESTPARALKQIKQHLDNPVIRPPLDLAGAMTKV